MIQLKNIRKEDNSVVMDMLFEDSTIPVPSIFNLATQEFDPITLPSGYEWCKVHIAQAKVFILNNIDSMPDEATVMWY